MRIDRFIAGMAQEDFVTDRKTRSAVERELLIISEAYVRISEYEERAGIDERRRIEHAFPEVPWHRIRGIGNLLRHAYQVDADSIWETVAKSRDIAELVSALSTAYPGAGERSG